MAYNNYIPQFYPQPQQQLNNSYIQQAQQNSGNNLIAAYVLGEQNAKSYPVAPGQMAILIDMEESVIYTKTVDQFGRPLPLKILDYKERIQNDSEQISSNKVSDYVSKNDFENFKNEIREMLRPPRQNNYKKPVKEDQ